VGNDARREPVWVELAQQTFAFWTASGSQPISTELLEAALASAQRKTAETAAWDRLKEVLQHAASSTFENSISTRTHRALFDSSSGHFAGLAKLVDDCSPVALQAWVAGLPSRNLAQLVTIAGSAVAQGRQPMHGSHLKRYVKRLEPVLGQVDEVLSLYDDVPPARVTLPPGAEELSTWLGESWLRLIRCTEDLSGPEGRLAREFLEDLEDLARWGAR